MKITTDEQNAMLNEAKMASFIGEYISQFQPEDIDGDDIDLRFELAGADTGCDISIVEQFGKTATVIDKLLAHIDEQAARIAELEFIRESACKVQKEFAEELECQSDNESILEAIEELKAAETELAALRPTPGKPFGWLRVVSGSSFQIMEGGQRPPDRAGDSVGPWFEIYTGSAPVAVPDNVQREFVNQLRDTAVKYANAQCLRDVLSRQVTEFLRLNSGSNIDD